ncbi:hypothetical protein DA477_04940 [Levilactobacillus brevis]|uniref:hypothetical protein n=1 Tax=Levilactobacillus brevis TaxID=1580 RepID=UPI000D3482D6|nr:hypothetical protein [Levilactobacillus brevis]PUD96930.1 hypothetical protein DA477_04940 [Levilactobacillus brevis]
MFLVTFIGTLSVLVMAIVGVAFNPKRVALFAISYAAYYFLAILAVFIFMPSKTVLSLVEFNFFAGILFLPIVSMIGFKQEIHSKYVSSIFGTLLAVLFIVGVFGSIQTHLGVKPVYQSLKVKTLKSAPLLDKKETPIAIAPKTVRNKMNKAMSSVPNTSYYRLGDLQTQVVDGHAVYIAPVEFDGFWRWQRAHTTPGYFMIDATNINAEPKFVKKSMKYTPSAYFNDDAQRVIYNRYPEWVQEGNPQLEVDDQGEPYFIQTVYKARGITKRINYNSLHVVVLNSRNGATKMYTTQNAPKFINESIGSSTAAEMNKVFGKYAYGFWNAHFNKTDVKLPNNNGTEDGVTPVVDKHGNIYYFNDFTSPKSDADSTMGYSMINARTGELTYYTGKNIGVMDSDGAKKIADKEYVAQKWRATMPIMYNIDGTPTWVVSLLDSTGAFRSYAYIKAADQSVKAYSTTATDALDQYRVQLATTGSTAGSTGNSKAIKIDGKVERVAIVPNGSSQSVIFTLKGNKNLWTVGTDDYPKAVLLKAGDKVKITATVNKAAKTGTVQEFRNQTFM